MPTAGEKPGKGRYQCVKCGYVVTLADDNETLPPCPKCKATSYRKID